MKIYGPYSRTGPARESGAGTPSMNSEKCPGHGCQPYSNMPAGFAVNRLWVRRRPTDRSMTVPMVSKPLP